MAESGQQSDQSQLYSDWLPQSVLDSHWSPRAVPATESAHRCLEFNYLMLI
ncbi:hypothetical protein DPMN_070351 [Dreissena polymorpha]|uniref:Uncharacterized protein n=1 Tax=Dreissena polymorpha TaxID=45954 RepID=A0A9D3Z565_DREPO|nr:hypothetical protein DPMN_070351 [Dreissena polymorpha]